MAYTKQNFEDGQVLKAEHLNKMEDGIATACDLAYEETKLTEIIHEAEFVGVDMDGAYVVEFDESLFTGKEKELIIKFDGVEYDCVADTESGGDGQANFGNMVVAGGEDTGEPFAFMLAPAYGFAWFLMFDGNAHTIGITNVERTIKPIDEKYIPVTVRAFYIDSTYLYTDSTFTTKATKKDVQNAQFFVSLGSSLL